MGDDDADAAVATADVLDWSMLVRRARAVGRERDRGGRVRVW
jgi:hypothetical protein